MGLGGSGRSISSGVYSRFSWLDGGFSVPHCTDDEFHDSLDDRLNGWIPRMLIPCKDGLGIAEMGFFIGGRFTDGTFIDGTCIFGRIFILDNLSLNDSFCGGGRSIADPKFRSVSDGRSEFVSLQLCPEQHDGQNDLKRLTRSCLLFRIPKYFGHTKLSTNCHKMTAINLS